MTRKHYNALATEFAHLIRISNEDERRGAKDAIRIVADALKAENSAFDRQRFYTACGL